MATTVGNVHICGVLPSSQHLLRKARRGTSASLSVSHFKASGGSPSGPGARPEFTLLRAAVSSGL
eukprot:3936111-Alexandrium_andersonii.AAC.1